MLSLEDVCVGYSKNRPLIGNININVEPGKIIGIRGKNGCGKTTLMKGILNIIPFRSGLFKLCRQDISKWNFEKIARSGLIGYLPQKNRVFNNLTVLENMEIASYHRGKNRPTCDFKSILKRMNLQKIDNNKSVSYLSGGQKTMLALACLYIHDAPVLLLDEPTDGLDEENKDTVKNIFYELETQAKTMLLIEQDYEILDSVADMIFEIVETVSLYGDDKICQYPYTLKKK